MKFAKEKDNKNVCCEIIGVMLFGFGHDMW
jgi:hypothetical protein